MQTNKQTPYYKDMTDVELIDAYWSLRKSTHNWSTMARNVRPGTPQGRKVAREWGRADRYFQIVCSLLRKRGINPLNERSEA